MRRPGGLAWTIFDARIADIATPVRGFPAGGSRWARSSRRKRSRRSPRGCQLPTDDAGRDLRRGRSAEARWRRGSLRARLRGAAGACGAALRREGDGRPLPHPGRPRCRRRGAGRAGRTAARRRTSSPPAARRRGFRVQARAAISPATASSRRLRSGASPGARRRGGKAAGARGLPSPKQFGKSA